MYFLILIYVNTIICDRIRRQNNNRVIHKRLFSMKIYYMNTDIGRGNGKELGVKGKKGNMHIF